MIYEFTTTNSRKITIDLREVSSVREHGDEGCEIFLCGTDKPFLVEDPYRTVVGLWTNAIASPETAEAWWKASGYQTFGGLFKPQNRSERTEEEIEQDKLNYEAAREWEKIVIPLINKTSDLSLRDKRAQLAKLLTDEVIERLSKLRVPRHFQGVGGYWSDPREQIIRMIFGFYYPCDFDVETTDPATRGPIHEGLLAIETHNEGNLDWAVSKVQRAVEEIDFYFGRKNYDGTGELLSFLEEHDALVWDQSPGRPGESRW